MTELHFKGKEFVYNHHLSVPFRPLLPQLRGWVLQALALIDWHLQRAPHALADAWEDLATRGAGWVKRARASLALAPAGQREVVRRFELAVKLRSK